MKKVILLALCGLSLVSCEDITNKKDSNDDKSFEESRRNIEVDKYIGYKKYDYFYGLLSSTKDYDDASNIEICGVKIGKNYNDIKLLDSNFIELDSFRYDYTEEYKEHDKIKLPVEFYHISGTKVLYSPKVFLCDVEINNLFLTFYKDKLISILFDNDYGIRDAIELKYSIEIKSDNYEGKKNVKKWINSPYDYRYPEKVICLQSSKEWQAFVKKDLDTLDIIVKNNNLEKKNRLEKNKF